MEQWTNRLWLIAAPASVRTLRDFGFAYQQVELMQQAARNWIASGENADHGATAYEALAGTFSPSEWQWAERRLTLLRPQASDEFNDALAWADAAVRILGDGNLPIFDTASWDLVADCLQQHVAVCHPGMSNNDLGSDLLDRALDDHGLGADPATLVWIDTAVRSLRLLKCALESILDADQRSILVEAVSADRDERR
jgi:hypothetical protein